MILYETTPFPENVLKLGHFVGSSLYVGPSMMAMIHMQNRSQHRPLVQLPDQEGSDA